MPGVGAGHPSALRELCAARGFRVAEAGSSFFGDVVEAGEITTGWEAVASGGLSALSLRDPVAVRLAVRAIGRRAIRHRIARYVAIFMPTNLIPYFQYVASSLSTNRRPCVKPTDTAAAPIRSIDPA